MRSEYLFLIMESIVTVTWDCLAMKSNEKEMRHLLLWSVIKLIQLNYGCVIHVFACSDESQYYSPLKKMFLSQRRMIVGNAQVLSILTLCLDTSTSSLGILYCYTCCSC